jgi:hypothetical protein
VIAAARHGDGAAAASDEAVAGAARVDGEAAAGDVVGVGAVGAADIDAAPVEVSMLSVPEMATVLVPVRSVMLMAFEVPVFSCWSCPRR